MSEIYTYVKKAKNNTSCFLLLKHETQKYQNLIQRFLLVYHLYIHKQCATEIELAFHN